METLFVGKNLLELSQVDSTNSFANNLLSSKPAEGTAILASYQSQGRGQLKNHWVSQADANLTFSVILYPTFILPARAFLLNKIVSLAIQKVLAQHLSGQQVQVKWPNDILINRKKVAGILIENQLEPSRIRSTVIGIGLNVNQTDFPEEITQTATSMALSTGQSFDRKAIFAELMSSLEALYLRARSGKTEQIDFDYLQGLYGYGERIKVKMQDPDILLNTFPNGEFAYAPIEKEVVLTGVHHDGRLALEFSGKLHYYHFKEVEFIL